MGNGLESLEIAFDPSSLIVLNFALAVVMFGVALGLRVGDFMRLVEKPKLPLVGLSSQWIILPLWTGLLIAGMRPSSGLALGLCLVACCPGGNVSNFLTDFGKGNAALSVTLTLVSSFLSALMTPIMFALLIDVVPGVQEVDQKIAVDLSGMTVLILLTVVVPLVLGMLVNHYATNVADKIRRPVQWLSLAILAGLIGVTIFANREHFVEYVGFVFLLVLIHNFGAFLFGWLWGGTWGLSTYDRKAVCLETGLQNTGLGLIIIFNFFDGYGPMALVAAWWGVWHLISGFTLAGYWRRKAK
jgi:BASS family bile acid:Na+ symporter